MVIEGEKVNMWSLGFIFSFCLLLFYILIGEINLNTEKNWGGGGGGAN